VKVSGRKNELVFSFGLMDAGKVLHVSSWQYYLLCFPTFLVEVAHFFFHLTFSIAFFHPANPSLYTGKACEHAVPKVVRPPLLWIFIQIF